VAPLVATRVTNEPHQTDTARRQELGTV
jgi:hypothetical protein